MLIKRAKKCLNVCDLCTFVSILLAFLFNKKYLAFMNTHPSRKSFVIVMQIENSNI